MCLHCYERAKRAAETKEEREVRLRKRRETDRARCNWERQAEQSLRREIEDYAGETRAMETDYEKEIRLERQRQTEGDKRCGDCWAKPEKRDWRLCVRDR